MGWAMGPVVLGVEFIELHPNKTVHPRSPFQKCYGM